MNHQPSDDIGYPIGLSWRNHSTPDEQNFSDLENRFGISCRHVPTFGHTRCPDLGSEVPNQAAPAGQGSAKRLLANRGRRNRPYKVTQWSPRDAPANIRMGYRTSLPLAWPVSENMAYLASKPRETRPVATDSIHARHAQP